MYASLFFLSLACAPSTSFRDLKGDWANQNSSCEFLNLNLSSSFHSNRPSHSSSPNLHFCSVLGVSNPSSCFWRIHVHDGSFKCSDLPNSWFGRSNNLNRRWFNSLHWSFDVTVAQWRLTKVHSYLKGSFKWSFDSNLKFRHKRSFYFMAKLWTFCPKQ